MAESASEETVDIGDLASIPAAGVASRATVSGDPTHAEVAAIAAAVAARRAERARAAAGSSLTERWAGSRWTFVGRIARLKDQHGRPADDAPTDPWTAAGRTQRMK